MSLPEIFEVQAGHCDRLGSPFTARILRRAAALLPEGGEVAMRIRNWQGDASGSGDSVPLRLAGGLHALVLSGQDAALAALYPPAPAPDDARLTGAIRAAFARHPAHLLHWLDSPPQTNEAGRSAALLPAGMWLSARFGLPLGLLELGTSAGLNLYWDQLALAIGEARFGPEAPALTLRPRWSGDLPEAATVRVASRAGTDINPLDTTKAEDALRLLSYVWPDQPDRLARMRTMLEVARATPPRISRADAADWLETALAAPVPGVVTTVFHTIAWQYFPAATKARAEAAIRAAGRRARAEAPLAWLSMEADGGGDGAALRLRLWPGDFSLDLGRADFHGRWIDWKAPGASA
ncbi:MAG: DUF2332 family protein [Rhodobacteraceae bacterium]|nr:DUF2332 family protein [Paracoccaceae bacterium]